MSGPPTSPRERLIPAPPGTPHHRPGWWRPRTVDPASTRLFYPRRTPRGTPRCAVVVVSHNLGCYLAEALESVLGQTWRAREIVVVDVASSDDTADVAGRYAGEEVRYLRIDDTHPHDAKRAGFNATNCEVLVWLDADDVLPPDYLERGLPLFQDRRVGIVYSDVQEFGETSHLCQFPDTFDPDQVDRKNCMHNGSIVSRMAILISQALDHSPGVLTHDDWRLWRRVVGAGFRAAKQPAVYRYRRHPGQLSQVSVDASYYDRAGLADETITVFVPLSGRDAAWESHLRPWLDTQQWPRDQVRLVLADTSQRDDFHAKIRTWAFESGYPDLRLYKQAVGAEGLNGRPRPNDGGVEVNLAMRRIYARMARELATPYVLVIEDDHRPPADAIEKLLRAMDPDTAAVSGIYRGRSAAGEYVCWSQADPSAIHPAAGPAIPISGSGFGTLLLRRAWLRGETFVARPREPYPYDIGFAARVGARGGVWKLARDVLSEHYGAPPLPPITADAPPAVIGPSAAELEVLAIVGQCSHARVCSCAHRGAVECQPGGKKAGQTVHPSVCRACLTGAK
ncbi:MAG: glycosyltransferase family 2 protein [Isosphaeraceae bacterium]|nr:glycosyltransferase family 2 protein [Isosphaeraceae bacterium]